MEAHNETSAARRSSRAVPRTSAARDSARSTTSTTSTLIEFPGAARSQQPAWRKALAERVREIQERRLREAAPEEAMPHQASRPVTTSSHKPATAQQLGLVPSSPVEERPLNPIVAAALRRVERARQTLPEPPLPPLAAPPPASPSPVASLSIAANQPATTVDQSVPPQTAAAQQPTPPAHAASDSASSSNGVSFNGASSQTEVKPPKPATHGVDVNSPAYRKYKEEEAARSRAKLLNAKQLAAKELAVKHLTATTAGATRAGSGAAAGVALAVEPVSVERQAKVADSAAPRHTNMTPVQTSATATADGHSQELPQSAAHRVTAEILDEATLARHEAEEAEAMRARKSQNDYAPFTARIAGGAIDVLAVMFLCSPVAATFEVLYADWSDIRIVLAMTLAVATITFLYIAAATIFAGRTWGMSLFNLRTVDVESGMTPTVEQGVRRGVAYVFSLLLFGLGFLYALIDPEGRGAHDHLSGTVVISE